MSVPRETSDPLDAFEQAVLYAMQRAAAKRRRHEERAKMAPVEPAKRGGRAA